VKEPWYTLNRKQSGSQSLSGSFEEEDEEDEEEEEEEEEEGKGGGEGRRGEEEGGGEEEEEGKGGGEGRRRSLACTVNRTPDLPVHSLRSCEKEFRNTRTKYLLIRHLWNGVLNHLNFSTFLRNKLRTVVTRRGKQI